ncbi:MAG: hypothetical protein HY841_01220 [Bacteroidetes bacterium]|nr:hypothetical protein [Bacteroidota bacterium]
MKRQLLLVSTAVLGLTVSLTLTSFSQDTTKTVDNFLKLFPKTNLPVCIDYKKDKFLKQDGQQGEILAKPDSQIISNDLVKKFLLADTEQLYYYNTFGDTSDCNFYSIKRISTDKSFNIIVYERQYNLHGWTYSEKFLCTLTKQGKLISKVLVASYNQQDFFISSDGGRVPFYAEKKGCIEKGLQINVIIISDNVGGANEIAISYLINADGQIIKQTKK